MIPTFIADTFRKLVAASTAPQVDEWQLLPPLHINEDGWLEGEGVELIKAHPSWFYPKLSTVDGVAKAIVAHCSDTAVGTARNMARNRVRPRRLKDETDPHSGMVLKADRAASWHASVEPDVIVQMISFECGAWHAPSLIKGVGSANRTAIGIEMVGKPPGPWSPPQVANAARLWRAVVQSYGIKRSLAMISHQSLDPVRRSDPGKPFMTDHAPAILDFAFAA